MFIKMRQGGYIDFLYFCVLGFMFIKMRLRDCIDFYIFCVFGFYVYKNAAKGLY